MNKQILSNLIQSAMEGKNTFPDIVATLLEERVESYHVDFLRNEYRYYAKNGESYVSCVPLVHNGVAPEFFVEKLASIIKRVQANQASYPDFVKEAASAGCAYYIVYLDGKKVRYFGRNGGEHVEYFPGSR